MVAHLVADDTPVMFQGGTALQVKLKDRTRFSIDVDIRSTDPDAVDQSLRAFVNRFPNSGIRLVEPPESLKIDGVRHTLLFPKAAEPPNPQPIRILVEVVPTQDISRGSESLDLIVDDLDWECAIPAPTLEGFAAQKLAVIGPGTVGKAVGPNDTHARSNQGVCKQIHDLGQLLQHDLDGDEVRHVYAHEIDEANSLRGTRHSMSEVLDDAARLLEYLREPRPEKKEPMQAYALWSGFKDSIRWVRDRENWDRSAYRITGGVLHRVISDLRQDRLRWGLLSRPLREGDIDEDLAERLDQAVNKPDEWVASDQFAGNLRAAWAWSTEDFW